MDWRHRIVAHPDVLVGKPVIKGTRISVELVMDLLAGGDTTDQIIDHTVLARAQIEQRVTVTCDTDFGELAFRYGLPASCGVVLIRIEWSDPLSDNAFVVAALTSRDDWST